MTSPITQLKEHFRRFIIPIVEKIYTKKPLIFFGLLLSFYLGYFSYMSYQCYTIISGGCKDVEIFYDEDTPNFIGVECRFKDAKLPVDLGIRNLSIEFYMGNESQSICKLKGNDFKIFKMTELNLHQNFELIQNKKFDLEKLKLLFVNGLCVKISFKLKCKFLTFPFKTIKMIPFGGGESPVEIINHKIGENSITSRVRINIPFLNLKIEDFNFDVVLNNRKITNVNVHLEKNRKNLTYLELESKVEFDKNDIYNTNKGLIEVLNKKQMNLRFCNLSSKNYVLNVLFNIFRKHEITGFGEKKLMVLSTKHPAIDVKLTEIHGNKMFANFDVHKSLIDHFVPSHMFLNKITIPELSLSVESFKPDNTNVFRTLGAVTCKNIYRKDYMSFKCEFEIIDFRLLIQNVIDRNEILKISIVKNNLLGKFTEGISFLWNYFNGFNVSSTNVLNNDVGQTKHTVRTFVNHFKIDTELKCTGKRKFIVKNHINLPAYKFDREVFRLAWCDLSYTLDFGDFQIDGKIAKSVVYLHKNFSHPTDILRGDNLEIDFKVSNIKFGGSSFCFVDSPDPMTKTLTVNFKFTIHQTKGYGSNTELQADLKYRLKKTVKDKPFLTRLLKRVEIQLLHIKSISTFDACICAIPIYKKPEIYNIDFNIKIPKTEICLKSTLQKHHFLEMNFDAYDLAFSFSNGVAYNIETVGERNICVHVVLIWKEVFIESSGFLCAQKSSMDALSLYINGLLSQTPARPPSIKDVNFKENLLKVEQLTDGNAEIILNFDVSDELFAELEFRLPHESVCNNQINKGSRIVWDDFSLDLIDNQDRNFFCKVKAGDISMQTEQGHDIYQECDRLKCELNHDLKFECKAIHAIYKCKGRKQVLKFSNNNLDDFFMFVKKHHNNPSNEGSVQGSFHLVEAGRSIYSEDQCFKITSTITLHSQKVTMLSEKLGNLIKQLNLKCFPRKTRFKVNGTLKHSINELEIDFRCKIDDSIALSYTGEKSSKLTFKSEFIIRTYNRNKVATGFFTSYLNKFLNAVGSIAAFGYNFICQETTYKFDLPFSLESTNLSDYIRIGYKEYEICRVKICKPETDKKNSYVHFYNVNMSNIQTNREISLFYVQKTTETLVMNFYLDEQLFAAAVKMGFRKIFDSAYKTLLTPIVQPIYFYSKFMDVWYGISRLYKYLVSYPA